MVTILTGDCREVLKTLPDASVHCCVTSPPYWGLRDYGHAGQIGLEQTPDCGLRGKVRLRADLTEDQRRRVDLWLLGEAGCGDVRGDNAGKV